MVDDGLTATRCFIFLVAIIALELPASATEPNSASVIGVNESLAAAVRALQIGNHEEGIQLTLRGMRDDLSRRHRASALSNLCAGYVGVRRYPEALAACDEALTIDGRNWRVYNNRALALLGLGRIGAARADLEAGLELRPESARLDQVRALLEVRENDLRLASIQTGAGVSRTTPAVAGN